MTISRNQIKAEIPEDWKLNLKKGLCPVCAKPKNEFQPRMKVYCSHKCRDMYYSKITTWQEIRDRFLKRHGEFCDECSITKDKYESVREKRVKELMREFARQNPEIIELKRKEFLELAEDYYRKAMDDDYLIKHVFKWKVENKVERFWFEVDHILAICNGGDMWDENNLQVLCNLCHKDKTKKDMEIRKKRRKCKSSSNT